MGEGDLAGRLQTRLSETVELGVPRLVALIFLVLLQASADALIDKSLEQEGCKRCTVYGTGNRKQFLRAPNYDGIKLELAAKVGDATYQGLQKVNDSDARTHFKLMS